MNEYEYETLDYRDYEDEEERDRKLKRNIVIAWALYYLLLQLKDKKIIDISKKYGEDASIAYQQSVLTSASYVLAVYDLFGRASTKEEFIQEYPIVEKILKENKVLKIPTIENIVKNNVGDALQYSKIKPEVLNPLIKNVGEKASLPIVNKENLPKILNSIAKKTEEHYASVKNYGDITTRDFETILKLEKRNNNNYKKNLKELNESKFYTVVNESHYDFDECDHYIGQFFTSLNIIMPPYHPNCNCRIKAITKEEYDKNVNK